MVAENRIQESVCASFSSFVVFLRWKEASLAKRAKGDHGKVKIAARLREETLVTVKWIATELQMGTWTPVANRLTVSPTRADPQPDLNLCQK